MPRPFDAVETICPSTAPELRAVLAPPGTAERWAGPASAAATARRVGAAPEACTHRRPTMPLERAAVVALTLGLGALGCAGAGGSGSEAPEQLSVAEYDLAREAFEQGSSREALKHVNAALDLDDDNAQAAYLGTVILLGFCAQDAKSPDCRYSEAERLARMALEADEELRDARNALGVILVHQGRYEEAIKELEPLANDMIYASPEKAWGNLGWAYLKAGRIDEAIPALKRAVAAQPSFCVGHYWLGLAYQKKREHSAAREAFTRALEIPLGDCARLQDAFAARAESEELLGLRDEARVDWEKCRDLAPGSDTGKRCASKVGEAMGPTSP